MAVDRIELDPRHPSLDDHRPGGLPLFGTSMSVAALGASAQRLGLSPLDFAFEDVEVLAPCILQDDATHDLTVELRPGEDGLAGEVLSRTPGDETLHLRGRLRAEPVQAGSILPPVAPEGPVVAAAEVYAVFFHGPAFQVVAEARFRDGRLVARLADHSELGALPPLARLLEFGLQSAGLLELATSDRMMIPSRIARITPGQVSEPDAAGPIFAFPRYVEGGAIDIAVVAADGRQVMTIAGYQTVPLPFAMDMTAVEQLGTKLRGPGLTGSADAAGRSRPAP